MIVAVASILREIDRAGFATSVHRMRDYVELHAVSVPNAETLHLVCVVDGDDDEADVYLGACELARKCGVRVEA